MPDEMTIQCQICDKINSKFLAKCSDCGSQLGKPLKKGTPMSKQNKGKQKYKRRPVSCDGNKTNYPSRHQATLALKRVLKKRNASMRVYKCNQCEAFHLTKYKA